MSEKMLGYNVYATENYVNEQLASIGNIQQDWNQTDETAPDYIKNRTHYTEICQIATSNILEWDGNTDGLAAIKLEWGGFYKVSDVILEASNFINAIITATDMGESFSYELSEYDIEEVTNQVTMISEGSLFLVKEDNIEFDGLMFPEAGIYFIKDDEFDYYPTKLEITSGATPFIITSEVVHKLDVKYLPDTVADKEYVNTELANLVGTAPETLDTIEELATAFQENEDVVETLNSAIVNKADKTDLEAFATEEYVDEKLSTIGIPRLVTHTFPITATEEGQTVFTIGLESFNSSTDTVMVQDGRTMLFPNVDFTIVNNTVVLTEGWSIGDTGGIYVFKIEMY